MAYHEDYDDDRRPPWLLFFLLLLLLLFAAYLAWQWYTTRYDRVENPPPAVEETLETLDPVLEEPVIIEPESDSVEPEPIADHDEFYSDDDAYYEEDFEAPPPIEEAPAPVIPDNFTHTVYFDLMDWTLTPQAEAALDALMGGFDASLVTGAEIDGYTDTAGTKSYNQPLSARRAQVIRRYLIEQGVRRERITARSHGETNLAQETADGVREPLNRRVELAVRFD